MSLTMEQQPFHDNRAVHGCVAATRHVLLRTIPSVQRSLRFAFSSHFHPYASELVDRLIEDSVRGLQEADTAFDRDDAGKWVELAPGVPRPKLYEELFTEDRYAPSELVDPDYPVKDLDFSPNGAYAVYNWELFFHVPLTVAVHLSRNGRFEDAQRWFHHVFDPTTDSSDPAPDRYWGVRAFHGGQVRSIDEVLVNLSTGRDKELLAQTHAAIDAWKNAPFRPHVVARYRHTAYMRKAVMAYLDNLVAWGDALFRQDTVETVNEATQLYVLAATILGPRPQETPRRGRQQAQSYRDLRPKLDALSNALTEVELDVPFDLLPPPSPAADPGPLTSVRSLTSALYFCVPRNDKLLTYWTTVADRLFKIRNSLNLQGVFRRLAPFDPPIDPAMLAKAAAAGVDVGAVVAGLNQPLPLVRFSLLAAKAAELCQEVKSLGGALLTAIEKEDGEAMSLLRARHERVVLGLAEVVRYEQWQEAVKAREGLDRSFESAVGRYEYYERLLGREEAEIKVPGLDELDRDALEKMRFRSGEPEIARRPIEVDLASEVGDADGRRISSHEAKELSLLKAGQAAQDIASALDTTGAVLSMIPQIEGAAKPMGAGVGIAFGGVHLSQVMAAGSSAARGIASRRNFEASLSARIGGYARREQEWAFQSNSAANEITQIYKQWRAAQIREAIAEREWRNHQQQMRHAEEIERFLDDEKRGKTSNKALYAWMRREVRGLYGQCFQFAFDVAKKAERALQHELGEPRRSFLQFGYQAGKQGLLAGERLYLDVKRMEVAYHELNQREYELTKHVSLRQIDPVALLTLRATGGCEFELPEEAFDLDCPGHYFRRIKSVALSIPCVTGPYAGVHATLTLQRGTVRTSPALVEGVYARDGDDMERFTDHFGAQSIVTSAGNQDSGLFETNLRDERYLPFEGAGAISRWRLELPAELPQFDHDTITDVMLHVRYTAREGGVALRNAAEQHLRGLVEAADTIGSVRVLSMRHEFPTEWARFTGATIDDGNPRATLSLNLRAEHYPFWAGVLDELALHGVELYAESGTDTPSSVSVSVVPNPADDDAWLLETDQSLGGLLIGSLDEDALPPAIGELRLHFADNSMRDVWLVLTWGASDDV